MNGVVVRLARIADFLFPILYAVYRFGWVLLILTGGVFFYGIVHADGPGPLAITLLFTSPMISFVGLVSVRDGEGRIVAITCATLFGVLDILAPYLGLFRLGWF